MENVKKEDLRTVSVRIEGRDGWTDNDGFFHGWGSVIDYVTNGTAVATLGIVELAANGQVCYIDPSNIKFTDKKIDPNAPKDYGKL